MRCLFQKEIIMKSVLSNVHQAASLQQVSRSPVYGEEKSQAQFVADQRSARVMNNFPALKADKKPFAVPSDPTEKSQKEASFKRKFSQWVEGLPSKGESALNEALKNEIPGHDITVTALEGVENFSPDAYFPQQNNDSQKEIDEVYLSHKENQELHDFLDTLQVEGHEHKPESADSIAEIFKECLDASNFNKIAGFPGGEKFAMIIRNLPGDRVLPSTPDGTSPQLVKVPVITASILGVLGSMKLHAIAYQGEDDQSVFRHVTPRKELVDEVSSYGSSVALGMHMDDPHLPMQSEPVEKLSANPEYLTLTGVKLQVHIPTRIVDSNEVLNRLPKFVIDELMSPNYLIKRPMSFSDQSYEFTAPVFTRRFDGQILCRYDQENVSAKTNVAALALKTFKTVANQAKLAHRVLLNKGDLLIFKNQQTLHAREGFVPRFDGADRWIIRVFGIKDLTRTIPVSSSNPYIVQA